MVLGSKTVATGIIRIRLVISALKNVFQSLDLYKISIAKTNNINSKVMLMGLKMLIKRDPNSCSPNSVIERGQNS